MNEMIDGVARALCAAYGNDWADTPESGAGLHAHDGRLPDRADWRNMALAAVRAMRAPTEAMVAAGRGYGVDHEHPHVVAERWRAMIDAALSDG